MQVVLTDHDPDSKCQQANQSKPDYTGSYKQSTAMQIDSFLVCARFKGKILRAVMHTP